MFQGSGTNLKKWNENTQSKFLDRLKKLGSVYTYQDKIHNIWHYDKTNKQLDYKEYDADIDIDLAYVNPNTHIKMAYDDIQSKYNIAEYKFIPMGWSAGCYLSLYFAQVYSSQCIHVILLDPALWTPNNIKILLKSANDGIYPITNSKYKKMIKELKIKADISNVDRLNNLNYYIRFLFISKNLKLELSVPTLAFVNIQDPEKDEWSPEFNNKRKLEEIKILEKYNPEKYKAIKFINKTHYIFDMIQPSKEIIKQIQNIIVKL